MTLYSSTEKKIKSIEVRLIYSIQRLKPARTSLLNFVLYTLSFQTVLLIQKLCRSEYVAYTQQACTVILQHPQSKFCSKPTVAPGSTQTHTFTSIPVVRSTWLINFHQAIIFACRVVRSYDVHFIPLLGLFTEIRKENCIFLYSKTISSALPQKEFLKHHLISTTY